MLKNIPKIISPELMKNLMEMGHGDEIVIADGNFPCKSCNTNIIRCDGHGVPELLEAVLQFFPLDAYTLKPVMLMQPVGDDPTPDIWKSYNEILHRFEPDNCEIELIERFAFYERAKKAFAVIATGEEAVYANIILKKGVVK